VAEVERRAPENPRQPEKVQRLKIMDRFGRLVARDL